MPVQLLMIHINIVCTRERSMNVLNYIYIRGVYTSLTEEVIVKKVN